MTDIKYLDSSEIPTFLNEMAMRFPENSRERIGLIECSMYVSVVRSVLENSRRKEPVIGIRLERGEAVPYIDFRK